MSNLKHTPAPWKITPMGNISGGNDIIVVTTQANLPVEENEANQKLIASAPELLEALIVLPENTGFAHVQDVPTMIEKAANLLEIKAVNEGNPDAHQNIITALLLIAQNHRNAIKKAAE